MHLPLLPSGFTPLDSGPLAILQLVYRSDA